MTERAEQIEAFLLAAGWQSAQREPIAGDASNRRYVRLHRDEGPSAILMDAPAEKGEDVGPFVRVAKYLLQSGLSAPQIYEEDPQRGFLLLEDLGNAIFARELENEPSQENAYYQAATDVLVHLRNQPVLDLKAYDANLMVNLAAQAFDWYQLGTTGRVNEDQKAAFAEAMLNVLKPLDKMQRVVIQRDYHAENLLWLPDRAGVKRVGLLDFQDAMLGHPAYDLVSVLQDARRDVSPAIEANMLDRYIERFPDETFRFAYACLGIQRNMRILYIFARLSMAYGKPHYVDLIPRVWRHLARMLDTPGLEHLSTTILPSLPEPNPSVLKRLRDQCGKHPIPS